MRAYLALFSSRFNTMLQYRAAAIAGAGTQLFFGLVRMMIFDAFYLSSPGTQPMSHDQITTYIWLGQAMFLLTLPRVDSEVAAMVRTGGVAYEMVRPLDLYTSWFVRALSGRAAPLLMRSIPIFVFASLFFGLRAPSSLVAGVLFVVSAAGGLLLVASLMMFINVSLLWTISGEGISQLVPPLIWFFSGIVVPLPLLPDWTQQIMKVLPFRGLIDTPFRIYMGQLSGADAIAAMSFQLVWIVVFVAIGRMILARGIQRLVVQGG